jgi:uncharacterized protein YkwD
MFVALFATAQTGSAAISSSDRSLLGAMNHARAAHGLAALRLDATLQRAARAHSRDMLRRNYFAHGPYLQRIVSFGTRGPVVGENLAWGVGARARASWIVQAWLRSPLHRRNLLRPGFRRVGVASLRGTFNGLAGARVVTADFAGT